MLEIFSKLYGLLLEGKTTLEQVEGHPQVGAALASARKALAEGGEDAVFPALLTAVLQGKRDAAVYIPLLMEAGQRREFFLALVAAIGELADAAGVPREQRVYSKRWALQLANSVGEATPAIQGDSEEAFVASFRAGAAHSRAANLVRGWARPRPQKPAATPTKATPDGDEAEAPDNNASAPADPADPLAGIA